MGFLLARAEWTRSATTMEKSQPAACCTPTMTYLLIPPPLPHSLSKPCTHTHTQVKASEAMLARAKEWKSSASTMEKLRAEVRQAKERLSEMQGERDKLDLAAAKALPKALHCFNLRLTVVGWWEGYVVCLLKALEPRVPLAGNKMHQQTSRCRERGLVGSLLPRVVSFLNAAGSRGSPLMARDQQ